MKFFSSDFHYGHTNIVRGCSNWEDKSHCRDFNTIEQHNKILVDNINKTVGEDDELYFLGDWSFGHHTNIAAFRHKIKCKTIHSILGNHDEVIRERKEYQNLFASVNEYSEIKVNGQKIILCHYAMRVWNHSHRGSWMLYGHSHGTLDDSKPVFPEPTWIGDNFYIKNSKSMDVGIDCHSEFRPFSFDEIKEIMDKREILLNVDHHDNKTN